jgi:hypothetical protein
MALVENDVQDMETAIHRQRRVQNFLRGLKVGMKEDQMAVIELASLIGDLDQSIGINQSVKNGIKQLMEGKA